MEEFDEFEEVPTNVNMRFRELATISHTNLNYITKPKFTQLKNAVSKNKAKLGVKVKVQKVEKTKKKQEDSKETNSDEEEEDTKSSK